MPRPPLSSGKHGPAAGDIVGFGVSDVPFPGLIKVRGTGGSLLGQERHASWCGGKPHQLTLNRSRSGAREGDPSTKVLEVLE
jgi:hypothetical protein